MTYGSAISVNSATCGVGTDSFLNPWLKHIVLFINSVWTCDIPPTGLSLIVCNGLSRNLGTQTCKSHHTCARDEGGSTPTHLEGAKFWTIKDSANSCVKKATTTQQALFFLHRKKREDWMNWTNAVTYTYLLFQREELTRSQPRSTAL